MQLPIVSIVTPTLNSETFLEETIQSIINQDYPNIEYIIVDGCSTDNTQKIIEKYKDKISKVIIKNDENMYQAINTGFINSSGSILSWLNSDDLYYPSAVKNIVSFFSKNNTKRWVVGKTSKCINGKIFTYPIPFYYPKNKIMDGKCNKMEYGCISQESVFFKRCLYLESGGLELNKKYASDFLLWKKFSKVEELYTINKKIGIFRVRENQLSGDQKKYYEEIGLKYKYTFNMYRFFYSLYRFIKSCANL